MCQKVPYQYYVQGVIEPFENYENWINQMLRQHFSENISKVVCNV